MLFEDIESCVNKMNANINVFLILQFLLAKWVKSDTEKGTTKRK